MNKNFIRFYFSFIIFILISLFIGGKQDSIEYNLKMPISLTLLNNRNVIISSDGIHFYNENLTIENSEKKFIFETPIQETNIDTISMAQFEKQYGEYILILAQDRIYIFSSDETLLKDYNLSSLINGKHYSLIPYRKYENDYLDYFILFVNNLNIYIKHFRFDLNNQINQIENEIYFESFTSLGAKAGVLNGINCIFMAPISSFNISHDLLTCFYSVHFPSSIVSSVYDQENNFTEIIKYYQSSSYFSFECSYVNGITNKYKSKALVFINQGTHPYSCTFDFTSGFSPIVSESENDNYLINENFFLQKIIYNTISDEFIFFGKKNVDTCKICILIYDNNYKIKKRGILSFDPPNCYSLKNFSPIKIGDKYSVLANGNDNSKSFYKFIDEMELLEEYTYEIASSIITDTFTELNSTLITNTSLIENTAISDSSKMSYNFKFTDDLTTKSTSLSDIQTISSSIVDEEKVITEISMINTSLTEENIITDIQSIESSTIKKITSTDISTINSSLNEEKIITDIPTIISKTEENKINDISTNIQILETNFIDSSSEYFLTNIKCKTSTFNSYLYNLCTSCNEEKDYYQAVFPDDSFLHGFIECYNNFTKPINFYFDKINKKYKPCYETCETCIEGGNSETNNCLTCDANHRKEPNNLESNNCITKCAFLYYYSYGQYKCTSNSYCPEEANLYIKDLKKCTDNCNKEENYKYTFQYGGQCLKHCPNGTSPNEHNICINNKNDNKCTKSQNEIKIEEFLEFGGIDINIKTYIKEFSFTSKHVSYFYDNKDLILFYKDSSCIEELSMNMPKIDFGNCYSKIKNNLDPPSNSSIIIALINRINEQQKSIISYSFYHPETGKKIEAEEMCKDEEIIVKSSVLSELNNSNVEINSILILTQQDINIFNLSDEFYTDICYHFESPNGKDIPLPERIKTFYPNITLCDSGCKFKGIDLNSLEAICECKFNDIMKNELIGDNYLLSNTIGEIASLFRSSNLIVLKCYKNAFKIENIKGTGGFIIIGIMFLILVFSMVFIFYDMPMIRKFLCGLSEYFIELVNKNNNIINNDIVLKGYTKIKAPPKKKKKKYIKLKKNKSHKNKRKTTIFMDEVLNSNLQKTESRLIKSRTLSKKRKKNIFSKKMSFISKDDILSNSKVSMTKNICININMKEYLKPNLDDLEYDDAIKEDKRSFCEFVSMKLKEKQIIMSIFFYKENIRPITIKIILFLLYLDLYFIFNGFFYNEKYLSELFHSNKEETFFSFIPRSISRFIYATLVGLIIGKIIDCLFIEEKRIKRIFLRERDKPVEIRYEISIIITSIKKRYYIFIFICLLISIFSWYYVICFNTVYPGVKMEWIKSSITIIIIMQFLSIIIAFLEAILRALSFYCKSEKLYKFKKLFS